MACLICGLLSLLGDGPATPLRFLTGDTFVHDPSTILSENGRYHLFGTGRGLSTKSSADLVHWTAGAPVFVDPPAWTTQLVPEYHGHTWAPDVVRIQNRHFLYYSVSSFGKQVSAIGLMTSPTLDPKFPTTRWMDAGPVVSSTNGSPFNAIDPSAFLDRDGRLWLAFGSFWKGIHLVQLDPQTGLRRSDDTAVHRLAWHGSIEAPTLTRHGDFYYLFVNWGRCCQGTNSTYEVRVGRSRSVTGPYLDEQDQDLVRGGGKLFLETQGRFIGPGHIGLLEGTTSSDTSVFSYHYYDGESAGRSRLGLATLRWRDDGWPVVVQASNP